MKLGNILKPMNSAPPISKFDSKSVKPHQFTPEELVPQNMIRKAKKVLVPDDCKDAKYWARRMKNNAAAKRSREARHQKVKDSNKRTLTQPNPKISFSKTINMLAKVKYI